MYTINSDEIRTLARASAGGLLDYNAEGEYRLSEREAEMLVVMVLGRVNQHLFGTEPDWTYNKSVQLLNRFGITEDTQ